MYVTVHTIKSHTSQLNFWVSGKDTVWVELRESGKRVAQKKHTTEAARKIYRAYQKKGWK